SRRVSEPTTKGELETHVTVIGAGNIGRGTGHRLVAGGHDVTVVDRDPEEAGRLAEELRGVAEGDATVEAAAYLAVRGPKRFARRRYG
ncbi:MAG: NAD-binding protein, partial [Actinobacteria bacterium]|nr:NAD-binding protein [Actinomycetota bacterium]